MLIVPVYRSPTFQTNDVVRLLPFVTSLLDLRGLSQAEASALLEREEDPALQYSLTIRSYRNTTTSLAYRIPDDMLINIFYIRREKFQFHYRGSFHAYPCLWLVAICGFAISVALDSYRLQNLSSDTTLHPSIPSSRCARLKLTK